MWHVYVLRSRRDGMLYTGYTEDLPRRLYEHANGYVGSTTKRRPLVLIRHEAYRTKEEAQRRERFLKSGQGRKPLKLLLAKGER